MRDQSSPGLIFFDKHPRVVVTLSHVSISNVANQGPGESEDPLEGWWLRTPIVFQSYPTGGQKACCHHPWKKFPFGGLVFGEGVEISHSRTNRSSRQQHWPWLRAYHIDARPMAGSANWTDPGNANITGTVRVFTSTPEAVCPGASIDDHGPQNNVSIKVLCNSDLDGQQEATTIKTDDTVSLPQSKATLTDTTTRMTARCSKVLDGCWPVKGLGGKCDVCEGKQQRRLEAASCTESDIKDYCGHSSVAPLKKKRLIALIQAIPSVSWVRPIEFKWHSQISYIPEWNTYLLSACLL